MIILGISAYFHDSAAAILVNGKIIAAAQEERFTRIKHDAAFPINAVNFCLDFADCSIDDINAIVFYEKPFQKFERIIDSSLYNIPLGFNTFRKAMKSWFSEKLWIPRNIQKSLNYKGLIYICEHHEAHAASAFYSSPYNQALIVVIDAVGEKACTSISKGVENKITPVVQQEYPHSLGLFYSAFTYYCGFKVNSGEYKLMGLAPYGKPIYCDLIQKHFIQVSDDGTVKLCMKSYGFDKGLKMLSKQGIAALGRPRRDPESAIDQFYKDIAASVQKILEDAVIKIIGKGLSLYDSDNITLAGGVALNCVANQKLAEKFKNKNIWIQPASGDAGGAIGAALAFYFENNSRITLPNNTQTHVYLGPEYDDQEIEKTLRTFGAKYDTVQKEDLIYVVANYLQHEQVVGWFQGRMEFGPRALGNRSILASPVPKDMKSKLNLAIKKREGFRPFAPAVLEQYAAEWFENIGTSQYMLQTFNAKQRTKIPSCVHEDNTSRVQTIRKEDNPLFHDLIESFHQLTGIPILINTSFNLRGEPIVCTPEDAMNCFINTEMDLLVMNNFIVLKAENKNIKPTKNVTQNLD